MKNPLASGTTSNKMFSPTLYLRIPYSCKCSLILIQFSTLLTSLTFKDQELQDLASISSKYVLLHWYQLFGLESTTELMICQE